MKRLINFICLGVLVSVLGVACNGPEQNERPKNEIQVIWSSDEATDFFNNDEKLTGDSVFYEHNEPGSRLPMYVDTCVMINSMDDFHKLDFIGSNFTIEIPAIDFDIHTLVFGQYVIGGRTIFISKSLIVEQNMATMNLTKKRRNKEGMYTTDILIRSFLGIYPKIAAKTIRTNVIYED